MTMKKHRRASIHAAFHPTVTPLEDRSLPTATNWTPDASALAWMGRETENLIANHAVLVADGLFEGEWVVGLETGTSSPDLATTLGGQHDRAAPVIADTYIWDFTGPPELVTQNLFTQEDVRFYYPLIARQAALRFSPNDPLYADQWHLNNSGQTGGTSGIDVNIESVWDSFRGTGVLIAIIDDGFEHTHPDLSANVYTNPGEIAGNSTDDDNNGFVDDVHGYDFNDDDGDPAPLDGACSALAFGDCHGTSVSGVAAGVGNNNLGVSGAAPDAELLGLRLISAPVTDADEAGAFSYMNDVVAIYNNSWGPADDGATLEGPGPLALAALQAAATSGRGGLGNIFVWAAGNGLGSDDDTNYDGYANSRYTIAVSSIDHNGVQAPYSEPGAPILVTTPSSGGTFDPGITTTDVTGLGNGYEVASDYTATFGGTSSSTPLLAGVIALMLEANPDLTYRDVQHILVKTAVMNDAGDAGWAVNGGGLDVNHKYGFGLVDAQAAVDAALGWETVAQETAFSTGVMSVGATIPDGDTNGISRSVSVGSDLLIEHVEVVFDATHPYRGDLEIILTSPDGTQSVLAELHDDSGDNYDSWMFSSVHHWGEASAGTWTLQVSDGLTPDQGTWNSWELRLYGTNVAPVVESTDLSLTANSIQEGQSTTLEGVFLDADAFDAHEIVINWGDGSSETVINLEDCERAFSAAHIYADDPPGAVNTYTITATITDRLGNVDAATTTVTVTNVAPVVDAGIGAIHNEGDTFTGGGSFTDPGADDWAATVNYGDGSGVQPLALNGKAFSLSNTYQDNGSFTVTVTINDGDGGIASDTVQVQVNNLPPTATLAATELAPTNSVIKITFNGPDDPSQIDENVGLHYAVTCDGGSLAGATYANTSANPNFFCSAPAPGRHTVRGRVIDKDNGFTELTAGITVLTPEESFVYSAYRDTLGRDPFDSGLGYWSGLLVAGHSRDTVFNGIWNSTEHRNIQVNSYYIHYLGRPADAGGRNHWTNLLQNGLTEAAFIGELIASAEYQAAHASNPDYIRGLYTDVLIRFPAQGEVDFWAGTLNSGTSRRAVANSFQSSAENYTNLVDCFFEEFYDRTAGPGEKQAIVESLLTGTIHPADVVGQMITSNEYFTLALQRLAVPVGDGCL